MANMSPASNLSNAGGLYQSWYDAHRIALGRSIDNVIELLQELRAANSTRPIHYPTGTEPMPELLILRLDVRLGALHDDAVVQKLGKETVASVLEEKMSTGIRQLSALRERIDDALSKILVTGDVNAGKSTFCNALLRRRILPEDQQPCTAIFCEVLNSKKNSGLEEVHAIAGPAHDVFALQELEQVVTDTRYTQCKVFVNDLRIAEESLLSKREVVDITLIDAPGLNYDTTHTTAVFARQQEIDVVVFVVSAANHFTISARDFIRAATAEKEYLFIVVNAFDTIADKERCKKLILDQIEYLSPQTFKESSELVHFVSSNAVLAPSSASRGMSKSKNGGVNGDVNGDVNVDRVRDFEKLEASMRKFVLENRSRSKLAPAKTYLLNILHDINLLATANIEAAQSELDHSSKSVEELTPKLESTKKALAEAGLDIDTTIENTYRETYDHSRARISAAIDHSGNGSEKYDIAYPGPWSAFEYAETLKQAMLARIADVVEMCEDNARTRAVNSVKLITQLGILHGGESSAFALQFRPEAMFSRKRDALARQVDIPIELRDFIDWPALASNEKFASAGMMLTLATAVSSRFADSHVWLDPALAVARVVGNHSFRQLIIPGIIIAVVTTVAAHILQRIPNTIPRRLATKIAAQLSSMDYVHANSIRIADRVRKVLRLPSENVRATLDRSVRDLGLQREEMNKIRDQSNVALKYFGNLVRISTAEEDAVRAIDLEAPPIAPQ